MDEVTNPVEEPEVADVPVENTEQPAEDSTEEQFDEDGNPVEPEPEPDDGEEVEYEGKAYKVPKELKDALLRQSDYTRKTQEIAEQRKQYESAIARVSEVSEAETQALYKVAQIDARLSQYQNIDWAAWDETDPIAALRARQEISDLQRAREGAAQEHASARTQATLLAQQETAKRLEEGQKVLQQQIPGWGAEKANAIRTFAKEAYALSDEQIAQITDPVEVLVLHDAMMWRQSQKKAATVQKIAKQQEIKPAAKVQGKTPVVRGLSDDLPVDEWVRRRNEQVRKRNK